MKSVPPVLPLSALLVLTALAGCLGSGTDSGAGPADPGSDMPARVAGQDVSPISGDPLPNDGPGHDHSDPTQHDVAVNMELLAKPPVDPDGKGSYWNSNIPLGLDIRFGELDVKGDWLAQCSRETDGAYLWDISNRTNPVLASRIVDASQCPDLKLTDDANYLVLGGNKLYDLRDKTNVTQVFKGTGPSCHMCSILTVDGQEYVILSSQGSATNVAGRNVNTGAGFAVAKLTRDPPSIEVVGRWQKELVRDSLPTGAEQDIANSVHDQYAYHDPLLGKPVVVTAMWDYGVWFVDLSDPTSPTDLGSWGAYRGESGNIHTVAVDFRVVDGEERRILVGATETGWIIGARAATEPGYLFVFDATDLSNVELLGRWANPGNRPTGVHPDFFPVGEYSAHNLQFTMGKVYMAHYHAGVWVLDVDAFLATNPAPKGDVRVMNDAIPVMGVMLTRDPERQVPGQVWDLVVKDGFIYVSDYALGLFVMHYLGDPMYDPAYTGTA